MFMPKVHSYDYIAVFIQYGIQLLMEILIHPPSSQGRCHSRWDMSGHYNLFSVNIWIQISKIVDHTQAIGVLDVIYFTPDTSNYEYIITVFQFKTIL